MIFFQQFDKLYMRAKELDRDYVVTGHYARVEKGENGNVIGRHKGVIRYTTGQRKGLLPAVRRLLCMTVIL